MKTRSSLVLILLLSACLDDEPKPPVSPFEFQAIEYIKNLVNPASGLVASRSGECFTTVYKNSLAAMVFLHEGNHAAAQAIFDRFESYRIALTGPFEGFPQDWDPCTGLPLNDNRWEGDNAFLLLALNYHLITSTQSSKYDNLRTALMSWLLHRSDFCGSLVAEGTANMYAALLPYGSNPPVKEALDQLLICFGGSVNYPDVLDHTVRASLILDDFTGFDFLPNFKRTENWIMTSQPIHAYSAFSGDSFINVEISAQLLLAATLTDKLHLTPDLRLELEKLWIYSNSGREAALPYFLDNIGFGASAERGIIDPTAYMLFVYCKFNPFNP